MHTSIHTFLAAALLATVGAAQNVNATLLSHYQRTTASTAHSDVWGYTAPDGREYAIFGERDGISILETTDPRSVKPLGFFAHFASSYAWRDYTNVGRFIYAVSELHRGMRVFEIQGNGTVTDHGYVETSSIGSAHNIRSDPQTGYLYVVGGSNRGMAIYDASQNPTAPKFLAVWNINYIHDACIRRGKAYVCNGSAYQTRILDIRNPLNGFPQIGSVPTAAGYNHSAWVSEDDKILCICNELSRGTEIPHMEVFDISNPAAPVKRGDFDLGSSSIAHNVFVTGRAAYLSYYVDGVHLVDLSDPTKPTSVASYKTSTRTGGGFFGTWGVYPWADSGVIYASDMQTGFFAVQLDCGHMNRFGAGTAGNGGVPRVRFDGALPRVGASAMRLEIENLTPNQQYWVAVSTAALSTPQTVLGAAVHVDLGKGLVAGPFQAGAQGEASLPAAVPNDQALANSRIYMQVFSHRGNGTLSASRGMWAGICK